MAKTDETLTMLKDLTDARGITGNEKEAREVMENYIKPYADKVYRDNLGSLIVEKIGNHIGPKIMFSGHLEKFAFMLTRIDDQVLFTSRLLADGGARLC